jgi:threonine dehydrogenase-like Zn-dependent dehydrogenase
MKAVAVFPRDRRLGVIDVPEPRLERPTDVKLRMRDVGICGTDKEISAFQYGTPPPGSDHLAIGHESLGEVIEVGPAVSRLRLGDLVVPMVRRPCPHERCAACRAGRQDFCYTGDFTERGIKEAHGFMTELVVDDERYMNVAPPALRDVAVLVEPLTIAEKGLMQLRQVQQRLPWACPDAPGKAPAHCRNAVVLGAGPVGLLGAMALVVAGFETFVYSRGSAGDPRARVATDIGARFVSADTTTIAELAVKVGNIDVVYEAAGASRAAFELMEVLGTNGVFIFTGVPGRKGPVEIDTDLLMRNLVLRNQVVFGTVNAPKQAFEAAIADLTTFVQRWPDTVRALISARVPLEAAPGLLAEGGAAIKNVVAIS